MNLLDEVHELQQRYADAGRYERMALNVAASLLEEIHRAKTGNLAEVTTRWTEEDYLDGPETFELWDGRLRPKHWKMYSDQRRSTTGSDEDTRWEFPK
jgi:hypothetical protein